MNKSTSPPVSHRVGITLNSTERAILEEAARKAFVSPSTLARTVLLTSLNKAARGQEPA